MYWWIDDERWCELGAPELVEDSGFILDAQGRTVLGRVLSEDELRVIQRALLEWRTRELPLF